MQRLAHGAEVADIAAGHRANDAERVGGSLRVALAHRGRTAAGGIIAAIIDGRPHG